MTALSLPPPQPGLRERSSGRAVQTSSSGTASSCSASSSTKSRRSSSAQWRSSNTSTAGPLSASASRNRRQAANAASSGRRLLPRREADERTELALEPRGLAPRRDEARDRARELVGRDLGVVGLEDPGLCLHDLAERPVGDTLAVGQRAAAAPDDQVGIALDHLPELLDEAALADPRHADERHELRALLAPNPVECVGEQGDLARPAHERGVADRFVLEAEARAASDHLPAEDRLGLPLRGERWLLDEVDRRVPTARRVCSPTRIAPGAAPDWSRAPC